MESALAAQHGLNQKTVAKWRKRAFVHDAPMGPIARAAGERYGEVWRRVRMDAQIPCSLEALPGGGPGGGPGLAQVLAHGAQTERARRVLANLRARLSHQPDLVAVCDAVCGEEKTPREAAAGERDAARVEALLKVALDLMAGAG
ncbi:hypothetical protein [Phenylobacterium sp.]|jgi:hypothetical protein|uniref:hypothetical protein n=1 Tax=Phenylobacterium sp. TaxID=1871053 RepID=UPI0037C67F1A